MIYINNKSFIGIKNTVISLGNFDGFHLGHQKLISEAIKSAKEKNLKSVVFSFFPHPKSILTDEPVYSILTSNEKRILFEKTGVDFFVEYPFTNEFAKLSPEVFIRDIIKKDLDCKILIVGEDYKFGSNQQGTINVLEDLCKKYKIELISVPHELIDNVKISSSNIRKYILNSDFLMAEKLMGRPYFIMGDISRGKKIGRTMGFPTANIIPNKNKLIPNNGIYITKSFVISKEFFSVTNIGYNPTVAGKIKTVETFLFDCDQEIYGKEMIVDFYKKIRDEKKFNSLDELKKQISNDVKTTREYFKI